MAKKISVKPLYLFSEITRVNEDERTVEAYAFVNPDCGDGWNLKRATMEAASEDYMKWANVREMHDKRSAAGITEELHWDDKGALVRLKVVDDGAWKKVKEGVYKGLSVGVIPTLTRGKDVEKALWFETSLVDRPADPDAKILVVRSAKGLDADDFECDDVSDENIKRSITIEINDDVADDAIETIRSAALAAMDEVISRSSGTATGTPDVDDGPTTQLSDQAANPDNNTPLWATSLIERLQAQDKLILSLQEKIEQVSPEDIKRIKEENAALRNQPARYQPVRFTDAIKGIERQIGDDQKSDAVKAIEQKTARMLEIQRIAREPSVSEKEREELALEFSRLKLESASL